MAKQRPFFSSLRGKITWKMLAVSLIPVIIIGVITYTGMTDLQDKTDENIEESHSAMQTDVVQKTLSEDAYRISLEMERDMATRVDYVQTYATAPICAAAALTEDPQSPEAQAANEFLLKQLGITPYFTLFTIIDEAGKGIAGAYWDEPTGRFMPGVLPLYMQLLGNDFTQMQWWSNFQNRQSNVYVSDVQYIPGSMLGGFGYYVIDIVAEVRDATGSMVGAVLGTTVFEPVQLSKDLALKYPSTRVRVFDRSGQLAADSGDWHIADSDLNRDGRLNDVIPKATQSVPGHDTPQPVLRWFDYATKDRPAVETISFTPAEQQVRAAIQSSRDEVIPAAAFTTEEGDYVVGYARAATVSLPEAFRTEGYAGTGFTFMTEQPSELAFAPLASLDQMENDLDDSTQSVLITLIAVLAAVFVVVLAVAFWISRSITRPVAQLSEIAEKVSMGDLDVEVEVKSNDEIGDLAASFGRMVAAVRFLSQEEEK